MFLNGSHSVFLASVQRLADLQSQLAGLMQRVDILRTRKGISRVRGKSMSKYCPHCVKVILADAIATRSYPHIDFVEGIEFPFQFALD